MNAPSKPKVLSAAATALPTATSMVLLLGSMLYSSDVVAQDPGALDGVLQAAPSMDQNTMILFFAIQVVANLAAALMTWAKTRETTLIAAAAERDKLKDEVGDLKTRLVMAELRAEIAKREEATRP